VSRHIIPTGDLIEHRPARDCPCGPTFRYTYNRHRAWVGLLYIHRRLDRPALRDQTRLAEPEESADAVAPA
jgi:hypothetical protein